MRFLKSLSAVSMALCASVVIGDAALAACTPKHTFTTVEAGSLTIAVTTYAPYSFLDGGKASGVDGDIATKIAEMECLALKPTAVDPAAAIQYVLSGRADIATGDWYRTAERAKVMNLSAPLYTDQMGLYSKAGVTKVQDLVGKQVGTVQGYLWVEDLKKLLGASLKLYPNSVGMQQDLKTGRIEIGVDGYSTGVVAKKAGAMGDIEVKVAEPDARVKATKEAAQAGFPYAKANKAFGEAFDADIESLHKDGTIAKILTSYGMDASAADTGAARLLQ
ncbi:substrate-binding periplasmic protein [Labrys monachus]|uniref:Polar amino acid transport system substrate-binding protein n=1 Tax=Labrys monachus TaxID=217067 RepID=A0ABU0FD02_9HYPH|nr:transporter substrate-binding domain-containing protein [Labrys monachus]MDQ0392024.1 polar amino acid transport system substrate-binding protein [Labrys monachus]